MPEADLDEDGGLCPEDYLDALVARTPSVESLLQDVRRGHLFRGFLAYSSPDNSDDATLLSKTEVEAMLSLEHVDWERLHNDLLSAIYEHRATSTNNTTIRGKAHTDRRFELYSHLAREYPGILSTASQHKKGMWRSGIDALAADFTRTL